MSQSIPASPLGALTTTEREVSFPYFIFYFVYWKPVWSPVSVCVKETPKEEPVALTHSMQLRAGQFTLQAQTLLSFHQLISKACRGLSWLAQSPSCKVKLSLWTFYLITAEFFPREQWLTLENPNTECKVMFAVWKCPFSPKQQTDGCWSAVWEYFWIRRWSVKDGVHLSQCCAHCGSCWCVELIWRKLL